MVCCRNRGHENGARQKGQPPTERMTDRADEFRRHAEKCLALARAVTDPVDRAKLHDDGTALE